MSELLLNWLNNEIELSKPIENFEKDFANGYLIGELLYKFNQQSNFKEFSKKDNVPSKIENFNMLQPTLKNLKIKFDSKMIDSIMKEQRGIALQLLYQLKMSLEKVYPPTDIAVLRKTGKMGDNQPALKIAHSKEKYDQHAQVFFQQRLQVLNKPQKVLNMESHLEKFEKEKVRQEVTAQVFHKEELDAKDKMRQEIRRAQINKLQRNAGFMEEWQQKGVEDWKKNQQIKKDREKRTLEFEYKQAEGFNNMTMRKISEANREVLDGIGQFENTLKNLGINPKVRREDADRAVSESLQNSPLKASQKGQRFSSMTKVSNLGASLGGTNKLNMMTASGAMTLTSTGLKTKDKKTVTDKTRMERERRRRKMIVDQGKTHIDMEQKRREQQIVDRMKRQANQEKELEYEKWRTQQCKNIIVENRKLREARYEKRRELDQQNAIWREEEMMKSLGEQMTREMRTFQERDREMRIVHKQAQRERRNGFGNDIFDAIFEIADQAYNHQQQQDSEEIDPRNWHEWLQLFIEDLPLDGSAGDDNKQVIELNLDEMELTDYLENNGQWPTTLITENPPNLEHFLTGQNDQPVAVAAGAKGKAPAPSKQVVEQIQLEEGDTELPQQPPNNYLLGDALQLIINLNFEERQKYKRPKVPAYLDLKLCIIGYAFSGKKTQSMQLKELFENFNFNVYQMAELTQEAVNFFLDNPEPIIKEIEAEDPYADEEISNDSELAEEIQAEDDFRQCGEQISLLLKEGQEITDDIYVKLFVSKLRIVYPHKSKKQLRAELRTQVERERETMLKIEALEREIIEIEEGVNESGAGRRKKRRDPNQIRQEQEKLREELAKSQETGKNGWILVDFPTNYAQAKLLEAALSGYVPTKEQEKIDREAQIEDAFSLVQPTAKEEPPLKLIKSGLDAVIWLDTTREECLRRALGRRFDHVNEKIYHIQDQPPLTTNAPLCERLVPMEEEDNSEATLIDRWIAFDQNAQALERWLQNFGESHPDGEEYDYKILNRVNGDQDVQAVKQDILGVLDTILAKKQSDEAAIKQRILLKIIQREEEEAERQRLAREEEEHKRKREEEGVEHHQEEQKKEEHKVTKPEPATEKIGLREPGESNIDNDFKPTLMKDWQLLSSNYKTQMKKVFSQTRAQRERIIENFSQIQKTFLNFLHRPDTKQEKLEHFIKEFNEFSDLYPDLREDDQTKDELHQRSDQLSDELWEIIEERKEQNIEERKKIMESGWIEYEQAFAVTCAQNLMQCEVDKFKACVQLLHDFYHVFEDKLIPEAPHFVTQDLVGENEELPPVETLPEGADNQNVDLYNYPRLDKLFEKALKTQVVPDVTQIQVAAPAKGAPPAKGAKDPKKPVEEEKQVEESVIVKEMKAAIKIEKSILRFRLTEIRNWTLKRLREMRQKALKTYFKLEDWILVSTKTENDAVDEMSTVIKRAIEEEKKIQDELRIKYMDFLVDEKIMNFIIPPPEKLPQLEEVRSDRFTIQQLTTVVGELEQLGLQHGNSLPNKVVFDLFIRKLETSKTLGDEGSLPEKWRNFTEYDFQNMIRSLDKYLQGQIEWKNLATYIILLNSPIASEKHIEEYKQDFKTKEDTVTLEQLTNTRAWFDEDEYSRDREYSIPFPRVKLIKELLFRVHRQKENPHTVSLKKYFKSLKAKELTMFKRSFKTYSDILLPQFSEQ